MDEEVLKAIKELGRQGGNTTKERYGKSHYSKAGKLGMAKRWGKKLSSSDK